MTSTQVQNPTEQEPVDFFAGFFANPIGTLVNTVVATFSGRAGRRRARRAERTAFAQFTARRLAETDRANRFIEDTRQLREGVSSQLSRAQEERVELANVVGAGPGIPVPLAISEFFESQRSSTGPIVLFVGIAVAGFLFFKRG